MVTKSNNGRSKIKEGASSATVRGCERKKNKKKNRGWVVARSFWKRTVVIMDGSGGVK